MEFEINDIIQLTGRDELFFVTGVIHDSERLFLTYECEDEFEVKFSEVSNQWTEKDINK